MEVYDESPMRSIFDMIYVDEIKRLEAEVARLKDKCDKQAMILRRLTPEKFPDTLFISGTLGQKDQNNMPEKLMVVPAYGVDFAYIYERTEKTIGAEW
jgi:hypothetical protein